MEATVEVTVEDEHRHFNQGRGWTNTVFVAFTYRCHW